MRHTLNQNFGEYPPPYDTHTTRNKLKDFKTCFKTLRQSWPKKCGKVVACDKIVPCKSAFIRVLLIKWSSLWRTSVPCFMNFKTVLLYGSPNFAKMPLQSVMATFYSPKDPSFFIFATCKILLFCFICLLERKRKLFIKKQ